MRLPPLSEILTWPTPNYTDPETRGNALLIVMIIFSILNFLAVSGRLYVRTIYGRWGLGYDDYMIILAFIFAIGLNAVVLLANRKYGWDRHVWDVRFDMIDDANIVAFTSKMLFVEASMCTRISLICFYHRLVKDTGIKWFRWILHASMFYVVSLGVAGTFVNTFLCVPVDSYWIYPPKGKHHCLDEGKTTFVFGIINCTADLLVTILPIPLAMRLKLPMKTRVGVCVLLCLGFIVTIAGTIRTYFIWKALINSWDTTWYSYPLYICSAIEIDLAVICACAPALKPWVQKHIHSITQHIAEVASSLHSSQATQHGAAAAAAAGPENPIPSNNTRSSKRSAFKAFFALKRSGGESIWDGEEEIRRLREREAAEKAGVSLVSTKSTNTQRQDSTLEKEREPTRMRSALESLGILKSASVDQEGSFGDRRGEEGDSGGRSGGV